MHDVRISVQAHFNKNSAWATIYRCDCIYMCYESLIFLNLRAIIYSNCFVLFSIAGKCHRKLCLKLIVE